MEGVDGGAGGVERGGVLMETCVEFEYCFVLIYFCGRNKIFEP